MKETQSTKPLVYFKCDHCMQEFSPESFRVAVVLYGIIFLISEQYQYFGIVCPNCINTTLRETTKPEIDSIIRALGKQMFIAHSFAVDIHKDSQHQRRSIHFLNKRELGLHLGKQNPLAIDGYWHFGTLEYTAFAQNEFKYTPEYFSQFTKHEMEPTIEFDHNNETTEGSFINPIVEISSDKHNTNSNYFISCLPNVLGIATDEDVINTFVFRDAKGKRDIHELIKYENESKIKALPRHVYYSSIRSSCDKFCNTYRSLFVVEGGKQLREPNPYMERLYGTRKVLERNFAFISVLEDQKTLDLETRTGGYQALRNVEYLFQGKGVPEVINEHILKTILPKKPKLEFVMMIQVIWDNFTKDFFQRFLTIKASEFALAYSKLSKRIDCSDAFVRSLKHKYVEELYNYIEFPHERKQIQRHVSNRTRMDVKKAEAAFPSVTIISQDSRIDELKKEIAKYARFRDPQIDILLLGESGTGKGLFAEAMHDAGGKEKPFVSVDCGAISENLFESEFFGHMKGAFTNANEDKKGYFELANGGTLFLDEIGNVPFEKQKKLLTVIESREIRAVGSTISKKIDVKIVYATNLDLDAEIENGKFKLDLFHRISGFSFLIPPLKDRINDIPLLIDHFIQKYDTWRISNSGLPQIKLSSDCISVLKRYHWPGNGREVENLMRKLVIDYRLGEKNNNEDRIFTPLDLPLHFNNSLLTKTHSHSKNQRSKTELTPENIEKAIANNNRSVTEAAKELVCSRGHLHKVMKDFGIKR
jgi:two-component system, NtrC family, response regulator HydG